MRALRQDEIDILESTGSRADDWARVLVADAFDPARIRCVTFQGDVTLESFIMTHTLPSGVAHPAGVYHTILRDVTVGQDALVAQIPGGVVGYDIEARAIVYDNASVASDPDTRFGQGTEIDVVVEAGGRPVPLFAQLSAQLAYCFAFYPDNIGLQKKLRVLVDTHIKQTLPARGRIGEQAIVMHCGGLRNVVIGPYATVEGASCMQNGVVDSAEASPTFVGRDVHTDTFAIATGATVRGGAQVQRCFVGQGARIDRGFSAENSLFFANTEASEGEACSFFAGPFSVSHHKSTLLLTALSSFYNAGSGSNASNHRYKLGPVHQGILERGCKTGSSSYLLWPAHVGPFTAVIGKHYVTLNTSQMPFSYLLEDRGRSILLPGANLFTTGTYRDAQKWRVRDRRALTGRLDHFHSSPFSPYTLQAVLAGREALHQVSGVKGGHSSEYDWGGAVIPAAGITKGHVAYDTLIHLYRGRVLAKRLSSMPDHEGLDSIMADAENASPPAEWVDICGLYAPLQAVTRLLETVSSGEVENLSSLQQAWANLHLAFDQHAYRWVLDQWTQELGHPCALQDVSDMMQAYRRAVDSMQHKIISDAKKEFSPRMRTGFGLSGATIDDDFTAVRGTIESNPFIEDLKHEIKAEIALIDDISNKISALLGQ